MPLHTSKDFKQYSWWRHLRTQKVFVVLEERLAFDALEVKILFEKTDDAKWKPEAELIKMFINQEIKEI
jgi:hypothetical protein